MKFKENPPLELFQEYRRKDVTILIGVSQGYERAEILEIQIWMFRN